MDGVRTHRTGINRNKLKSFVGRADRHVKAAKSVGRTWFYPGTKNAPVAQYENYHETRPAATIVFWTDRRFSHSKTMWPLSRMSDCRTLGPPPLIVHGGVVVGHTNWSIVSGIRWNRGKHTCVLWCYNRCFLSPFSLDLFEIYETVVFGIIFFICTTVVLLKCQYFVNCVFDSMFWLNFNEIVEVMFTLTQTTR